VILGVGAKIFGGKVHPSLELRIFRHLWSRSDAPRAPWDSSQPPFCPKWA